MTTTQSPVARAATGVRLVRRPVPPPLALELDPVQRQVVARAPASGPLLVVGAPGTGKTTTLVEAVVARVVRDGLSPSAVLVLAPTRVAAGELRERVTTRLAAHGPVSVGEPLARTPASYAFGLIRRSAVLSGRPSPRLISGPEQDAILRDLLEGHRAGEVRGPRWPEHVQPALQLSGFRAELRELLMRAMERGLAPADLAALGRRHRRAEWVAAADVMREYLQVTALQSPGAFDPAGIVDEAVGLLADDPGLLAQERGRWRLVAVDDHHESVEATARLLDQLAGPGADLLLAGDPDSTTATFRGADPALLARAAERHRTAGGAPAQVVVLPTRWRHGPALTELSQRVASSIGGTGARVADRRGAGPGHEADRPAEVAVLGSRSAQAAYVAGLLRRAHVADEVPWAQMAVVVRSADRTGVLRRALAAAGVPVGAAAAEVPVRDEPAARPLLRALRVCLEPRALDPSTADELLLSPLGGADALEVRRLRQHLLALERAAGGTRASDALLVEALVDPTEAVPGRGADSALRRLAAVLAAGARAAGEGSPSAEQVLWALWSASGLADRWRRAALAGGRRGRRADRDLDAVVALFEAAARFAERLPGEGARGFLDSLEQQDVPADTLAERAPQHDAVAVLTPQGAAGREWDVVVVAEVQEGVWPNTRLRGTLLGAPDLVDAVAGVDHDPAARVRAARLQVLHDELRMFHVALTRARRRLVVTAVRDADDVPSPFVDLVDSSGGEPALTRVPRPTTLRAVVAELRYRLLRAAADDDPGAGRQAAVLLARLAAEGVPGADPRDWYGTDPATTADPLQPPGVPVTVSPSAIEKFEGCPLRWLLETAGGRDGSAGTAAGVGSLLHDLAHELGGADPEGLEERVQAELARRWPGLGLEGWVGRKENERARAMASLLAGYLAAQRDALVGSELAFRAELGRAVLTGRVDRLERDPEGRAVVVDLKTTKSPPTRDQIPTNPQLGAYQVAVQEGALGDHESGGAALVHLGRPGATRVGVQQQPPLSGSQDPRWAHDLVERAAEGMAGAAFEARVSDACSRCPVRTSCPAHPQGERVRPGGRA